MVKNFTLASKKEKRSVCCKQISAFAKYLFMSSRMEYCPEQCKPLPK